ncbi:MAG: hypothetical protein R3F37_11135 [Candidatus Competibacteraceae bacterium]
MMTRLFSFLIALFFGCHGAFAEESDTTPNGSWWSTLGDGFSYRIQGLLYGIARNPQDSLLNPDNALAISRYQGTAELRPDLGFSYENLTLAIKPRFNVTWEHWEDGRLDGETDTDEDAFINEWMARLRFGQRVFVSYGREDLQWGPSFLLSPSNPFNPRNGRNNLWLEEPGLDYGKAIWVINPTWTTSLIANTREGRLDLFEDFRKTYATKVDYTGDGRYGSFIISHRESGPTRFGLFAGVTVSDAMLLHIEGSADDDSESNVLVGGTYTLDNGSTLALEYYHNSAGCDDRQIRNCFFPFADTSPDLSLFRRNYGLVQYFNNAFIRNDLELVLRGVLNFDDGSNLLITQLKYELNDYSELFTVAEWATGDTEDEFGALSEYSIMGGLSLTY